jgi:hypothetical protein
MFGDLDMMVEANPAPLPLGVFIRDGRQAHERRLVELLMERAPADTPAAHRPIVQLVEQSTDRPVELGQREELTMPQARQDPAPDDLHGDLHFGFVAGFVGTGRDDGGAVMPGLSA